MIRNIISNPRNLIFIGAFAFMLLNQPVKAQYYNTIYWMQGIPQASYSNPGIQPDAGFYLGFPGVSSLYLNLSHSGFAPEDLIKRDENGSSFYIDDQAMLEKLERSNFLSFDFQTDILGFGFRSKKDYISFNIAEKVGTRLGYSRDFMRLLVDGNDYFLQQGVAEGNDVPAELGRLSLDAIHYREFGVGYSRQWTDWMTAGIRAKALQGMGNVFFEKTDLNLTTKPNNYELLLNADLLVNTSLLFQLSPLDSIGNDTNFEVDEDDLINYVTNTGNLGFAIDLGANFKISENFNVAFSIVDLGLIDWKSDVENFRMQGEFEYNGIDFNDFFGEDNEDPFEQIIDSIQGVFDIEETTNSYRTMLPTKLFVSAAYSPARKHKFALLARGEYFSGTLYPSFTASYNLQVAPMLGTSLSYSVIHWNYNNIGFGLHLNLGPLQVYTVVDNFLGGLRPHTLQTATIHFGLNIVTGYRQKTDPAAPSIKW